MHAHKGQDSLCSGALFIFSFTFNKCATFLRRGYCRWILFDTEFVLVLVCPALIARGGALGVIFAGRLAIFVVFVVDYIRNKYSISVY